MGRSDFFKEKQLFFTWICQLKLWGTQPTEVIVRSWLLRCPGGKQPCCFTAAHLPLPGITLNCYHLILNTKKKSTGRNRFKKLYYWNFGKQAKKRGGGSEKHKLILEGHSCYEFAEKLLQLLETRCREQTTAKESNTFRVTQFPFSQTRQAGDEHSPISD